VTDTVNNVFDDLPVHLPVERIDVLVSGRGVRVERIVSTGQATPRGQWYDQDTDEWVLLLRGRARLRIESEAEPRDLYPGDHVLLASHVRHRVESTDDAGPTVWLTVHYAAPPSA
jgi:cupin 2 domain-containing protein